MRRTDTLECGGEWCGDGDGDRMIDMYYCAQFNRHHILFFLINSTNLHNKFRIFQ